MFFRYTITLNYIHKNKNKKNIRNKSMWFRMVWKPWVFGCHDGIMMASYPSTLDGNVFTILHFFKPSYHIVSILSALPWFHPLYHSLLSLYAIFICHYHYHIIHIITIIIIYYYHYYHPLYHPVSTFGCHAWFSSKGSLAGRDTPWSACWVLEAEGPWGPGDFDVVSMSNWAKNKRTAEIKRGQGAGWQW